MHVPPESAAGVIVRLGREPDAPVAARLHREAISEGFLGSLGPRFLTRLYRRIVRWPRSFLYVAEVDGRVVGQAAATEDVGELYREFLRRDGAAAGLLAAPRLLRGWRSVLETLRYPSGHSGLPDAELLAVAVATDWRGRGVGRALVTAANDELAARGVRNAKVVVGSANTGALQLYRSSGFLPSARIRVHTGTSSEVLTWS